MRKEELEKITEKIIYDVARNGDVMYHYYSIPKEEIDEIIDTLIAMLFSLHNLLYKEINGELYDYMWHWTNKIGINYIDHKWCDHYFDDIIESEDKE